MTGLLPALTGVFGDHRAAVTVGGDSMSWEQLDQRARAVAHRIRGADAMAVVATATTDTLIAVIGGLLAGVRVVPLAADVGTMERDHLLTDSAADILVGDPGWDGIDVERLDIAQCLASPNAATSAPLAEIAETSERTALVLYTSGTTGAPKGVELSYRAIASGLDALADAWAWTSDDHLAHGLPLFHVHGLILGALGPLRRGARLTHTVRPTPEAYACAVDNSATMLFGVPTVWSRVVAEPDIARMLGSARLLVSGSASLPTPVFAALTSLTGIVPIERYGMTETLITLSTRADGERRVGSVGVPVRGVEAKLVDDDGVAVRHDGAAVGNLLVRGSTLFSGYLNLADATAAAYDDGWFVTGDAATIDDSGMYRIVGRTSIDVIKSGGFKIGAAEIESVLLTQPGVADAAVVGIPDDDLGERVVAYVVAADDAELADDAALTAAVATALSTHKRPREVRRVDALPRNAMGKVQKHRLVEGTTGC